MVRTRSASLDLTLPSCLAVAERSRSVPGTPHLPLGRRWPEGPDEGAFPTKKLPPHQFGQMTYDRAPEVLCVGHGADAAVSHGLTSSFQGERGRRALTAFAHNLRSFPRGRRNYMSVSA